MMRPARSRLYVRRHAAPHDIKLPLDHRPEALQAEILKKLKLPAEALLDWRVFKRAHDARSRNAIVYIYRWTSP